MNKFVIFSIPTSILPFQFHFTKAQKNLLLLYYYIHFLGKLQLFELFKKYDFSR